MNSDANQFHKKVTRTRPTTLRILTLLHNKIIAISHVGNKRDKRIIECWVEIPKKQSRGGGRKFFFWT